MAQRKYHPGKRIRISKKPYTTEQKNIVIDYSIGQKIIYIGDAITPCELANEANIPIMERGMFIVCWDHKLNKYRNEEQTKIWNITTKN